MSSIFHKIVHLDLKGAPWQVEYLSKVIKLAKSWGATGILFEWEDTFPFTDDLTCVGSLGGSNGEGLYSHDEIQHLLKIATEQELIPIQLVQTMGHMEYVLKHVQYSRYRELSYSPAVLCPTLPESGTLVKKIVTQILKAQPDAEYIHIGADEAWHMNLCASCCQKSEIHPHGKYGLYLDHISSIVKYIQEMRPGITILMWDDMIRTVDATILEDYNMGALVQPVVWNYSPVGAFQFDPLMWKRYSDVFPNVWAASAFKGANGSCKIVSPVARYVSNQEAWIEELKYKKNNFSGVILTGWSRYDHYATLCELLPVSLPSLASCIKMWTKPEAVPMECVVSESLPSAAWPGEQLARALHTFVLLRERALLFLHGDQIMTWLNDWQLEHNYTNPIQAQSIVTTTRQLLSELSSNLNTISCNLVICGSRSSREWIATWGISLRSRLTNILSQAANVSVPAICPSYPPECPDPVEIVRNTSLEDDNIDM